MVQTNSGSLEIAGVFDDPATQAGVDDVFDFVACGALAASAISVLVRGALSHRRFLLFDSDH